MQHAWGKEQHIIGFGRKPLENTLSGKLCASVRGYIEIDVKEMS
jgi:hypothetical protein